MADATVSRLGEVNDLGGSATELFLKVFGGEVMAAFLQSTIMEGKHFSRMIASGKSAQFPATGRISAAYHTPGAELVGTVVKHNETVITIDGLLVAQAFVAEIDELMNHYDVRSIYAKEMGSQLAVTYDKNLIQEGILGSRASAVVTGLPDGQQIQDDNFDNATLATKAGAFAKAMFTAAEILDGNYVPKEGRFAVLRPADYYTLVQNTDSINADWGGKGSYADGNVLKIAGITILSSPNVPSTDLSGATYHGVNCAFSNGVRGQTKGLVFHDGAIGSVKLMDIKVESAWDIRRQGTLLVAKNAVGMKFLRPEALIELEGKDET